MPRPALSLAFEQGLAFTLIRDGDHRLSRPQDLERLLDAVEEVSASQTNLPVASRRREWDRSPSVAKATVEGAGLKSLLWQQPPTLSMNLGAAAPSTIGFTLRSADVPLRRFAGVSIAKDVEPDAETLAFRRSDRRQPRPIAGCAGARPVPPSPTRFETRLLSRDNRLSLLGDLGRDRRLPHPATASA